MASVFCEHGRVKTTCPTCKLLLLPPRRVQPEAPTGRAPGPRAEAAEDDAPPAPMGARGPGKPLMPTRKRARKASAQDMANADAWFVKKR